MKSDHTQGLYPKYKVTKPTMKKVVIGEEPHVVIRGTKYTEEEITNCFVLRPDKDPHSRAALKAYALSCREDYPKLSNDLLAWVELEQRSKEINDG